MAKNPSGHKTRKRRANSARRNSPVVKKSLTGARPFLIAGVGVRIEHQFPKIGQRAMLFSACRLYQQCKGTQFALIAIQDVTERKA